MPQGTFNFELVSPERLLASGEAASAVIPGSEGQFMVLARHAPVVSTLRPGVINVAFSDDKSARYFVKAGIVEVNDDRCTVLAQDAQDVEDLSSNQISEMIAAAKEQLAASGDDHDARAHAEQLIEQLNSLV